MNERQQILAHFARLLNYPDRDYRDVLHRTQRALADVCPAAAAEIEPLRALAATAEPAALEELFTAVFDLQPCCCPYVGYQLCGESRERTLFLLRLREIYRQHLFDEEGELPDHLAVMLRFLAGRDTGHGEIARDALLPALEKMTKVLGDAPQHPYGALLGALQAYLGQEFAGAPSARKEVAP